MTMFKAREITDYILSKVNTDAGDVISPLKLQKLLYYCYVWFLVIRDEKLFSNRIEAWAHGPVVPSEYGRFSYLYRNEAIDVNNLSLQPAVLDNEQAKLLNEVLSIYGEHSASYLEKLTHQETPWISTRGSKEPHERCNDSITDKSIKEYYSTLV